MAEITVALPDGATITLQYSSVTLDATTVWPNNLLKPHTTKYDTPSGQAAVTLDAHYALPPRRPTGTPAFGAGRFGGTPPSIERRTMSTVNPTDVSNIITEVTTVIDDALGGSSSLAGDIVVLGTGLAAGALELGLIGSSTEGIALAAISVGVPAIARIVAAIRHKAKAAAVAAVTVAKLSSS